MDVLNKRLGNPMSIIPFRPNVMVKGSAPYEEVRVLLHSAFGFWPLVLIMPLPQRKNIPFSCPRVRRSQIVCVQHVGWLYREEFFTALFLTELWVFSDLCTSLTMLHRLGCLISKNVLSFDWKITVNSPTTVTMFLFALCDVLQAEKQNKKERKHAPRSALQTASEGSFYLYMTPLFCLS